MDSKALTGVKVVELGSMIAAPYCGKMLADMGAEVIKVEPPYVGDEARHHGPFPGDLPHPERSGLYLYLNTNKLGITLDINSPTGRKILLQLLAQADVFVESNIPQSMKSLELDYDSLKGLYPRLIVTSITPFGQTGPYKEYKGYDINCNAVSGISYGIGEPDREPLTNPFSQADYQGALSATAATLAALLARSLTGMGQHADIAIFEVLAKVHGGGRKRQGRKSGDVYPDTIMPCKDGYMVLVAREGRQWGRFLEVMGNPEILRQPRYRDRRVMGTEYPEEVDAIIQPWFLSRTKDEIFALCMENRVPFAPIRTIAEVVNDGHLEERKFFIAMEREETGVLKYPGAPYKFSRTPWALSRPAPLLGEHNEEILSGRLGYSGEDLANLRRAGVI